MPQEGALEGCWGVLGIRVGALPALPALIPSHEARPALRPLRQDPECHRGEACRVWGV